LISVLFRVFFLCRNRKAGSPLVKANELTGYSAVLTISSGCFVIVKLPAFRVTYEGSMPSFIEKAIRLRHLVDTLE